MLHHFGSKSGKCLNASRMYSFEVKRNSKTPKGVIYWASYKTVIWDFWNFCILTPKIKDFYFSKINSFKIIFMTLFKKWNIYYRPTYKHTLNFKAIPLFLSVEWLKKTGKGDDVIFLHAIFGIYKCRTWKQIFFLILRQNWTRQTFFVGKFWIWKSD